MPELFELADIELELFSQPGQLARCSPSCGAGWPRHLHERLPDFDGAVVTHGTDTLAYTASALSFMLPGPAQAGGAHRLAAAAGRDPHRRAAQPDRRGDLARSTGPREVTHLLRLAPLPRQPHAQGEGGRVRRLREPELPGAGRARGGRHASSRGSRRRGRFRLARASSTRGCSCSRSSPGSTRRCRWRCCRTCTGWCSRRYGAGNFPLDASLGRSLLPAVRRGARAARSRWWW